MTRASWAVLAAVALAAQGAWAQEPGSPPAEVPADVAELDELLGEEVAQKGKGPFDFHWTEYGVAAYVRGYATADYSWLHSSEQRDAHGFALEHYHLVVGANVQDRVLAEAQLMYHREELILFYGQVDLRFHELAVLRVGKWLTPFGLYNEYLWPEMVSKFYASSIPTMTQVIPVHHWTEVGAQLRGTWRLAEEVSLDYVVYACNGLEQDDPAWSPGDPGAPGDGGSLAAIAMGGNAEDANDSGKSYGARVGLDAFGVRVGLSHYQGPYSEDGRQHLFAYGAHLLIRWGGLEVGAEGAYVLQERRAARRADRHLRGVFLWVAYRFNDVFGDGLPLDVEPAVGFDWTRLGTGVREDDKRGFYASLGVYPFPRTLPGAVLRVFVFGYDQDGDEVTDNRVVVQAALGF